MAKTVNTKKSPIKKATALKKNPSSQFEPEESKIAGTSSDNGDGFQKLLLDSIKDIYWAENQLVKSLPKLISSSASAELRSALNDHLEVTEEHVSRLDKVFELLGEKPQAKKCDAMEGLTKEAEGVIESTESGTTSRDMGIIMAAQKTEHYEISTYGGLAKLAKGLGYNDISDLLERTLAEEQEADQILASLAEETFTNKAIADKEI